MRSFQQVVFNEPPPRRKKPWLKIGLVLCLIIGVLSSALLLAQVPKKNQAAPKIIQKGDLKVTSPDFEANGKYPIEFTGDGEGISPPLKWSGAPKETKCYALQLWHVPGPGDVKSYWVLYNIPASVTSLEKNSKGVGQLGYNDKNRKEYDPMKSKGPGPKEYHITVYALSEEPKFKSEKVTRTELLNAIKDITLAESTLSYTYERKNQ
ncbi:YbhB/YbcL family Raf kinase inhibitor-like protein [Telmatocola sphagniphila]|uniref:YbhB/YbcL family Raf kinase inhibitor-like protein n=1 Tax=Telmatocola sphagniphila TaxID=1123043 RepID=A0A8E6EV49_9BACT|nr:YbhB/YbcL family Raf kinase inhibitor-like protein [Telmatocola sphagniphila]QVL32137.1 YbhB/YbcL family Raf kinase inhibitor-like protein [Telmatocola sphagniphila]